MEDVIHSLGHLALGTRLRRLGEMLQAETQRVMADAGIGIQAGHFPPLAAIDRLGPLTVGALAEALGIAQPGATRAANALVEAGYLAVTRQRDQRVRLLSLTAEGQALVDEAKATLWPRIDAAVAALCAGEGTLLHRLSAIEAGLRERPLLLRVQEP